MKFLDVKTDFAFKKVFGSEGSKDILISFLNSLIDFPSGKKIISLTIVDPYNMPMIKGMKDSYVDVRAVLDDKTHVIIEMQVLNVESFEKRVLYNAAKKYSHQLSKGENFELLNPVIALTIVDFDMFPDMDKVVSSFKLLEKEKFIKYSDDIELIFIELPKFNKKLDELLSITEKWIYFIKHAGEMDFIPKDIEGELKTAFEIINEASLSEEELEAQHKRHDFIYLQKSSISRAARKGREEGYDKRNLETARIMKDKNFSIKDISDITGLSIEEIQKL